MANLVPKVNNTGSLGTSAKKWSDVHTTTLSVGAQSSALSLNSQKITNLATPTAAADAATKAYVDDAVQGLSAKDSVRVATTANGTLASAFANGQTVDGVTLATGDRVLLKNQTAGAENGIYTVNASGAPTRAVDFDANAEVAKGAFIFVEEGTSNANAGFVLTTDGAITLGTTALAFTQFSGAGQITAGDGLAKSGNTLSVDIPGSAEMTGDVVDTDELLISDGGTLKRADFSVVRDAVFADVSGNATVAAGGALSLASAAITGQTAETSIADDDLILISDTSASGALRKMTKANFVSGLGGGGLANVVEDTTPQLGGALDVNGKDIVTVSNGNITLTPNGSGVVRIDGTSGIDLQSGEIAVKNSGSVSNIKLYCENANAHYTQIQSAAHASYSGNVTLTLPVATGTLVGSGDTGTVTNTMLAGSIANGKLANSAVTVTAGNGLSGGGSVALGATTSLALDLNELTAAVVDVANDSIVIVDANDSNASKKESVADLVAGVAGTGLSASSGQLSIDATVTTLVGSQTLTNKTLTSPVLNTGVSGTAVLDEDDMNSDSDTKLATQQSIKAYVDAQVAGGGLNIDGYSALGGTGLHQTQDHFVFSDNGTEKKITFSNLEDAIFANISGDATIAAGGALTIGANAVEGSMLNNNTISGQTEMTGDVADADELLISDAGTLKRADFSIVRDAVFNDVSGDAAIAAGGALTIAADAVTYAKIQNVSATDKILGRSSANAGIVEEIACTAAGRALLDDADAAAQRTTLGLAIGTNVQAYDADLAALAGLTSAADKGIQFTGSGTAATYDLTTAGKALLDDANAAAQRTTLGVGTSDSPTFAGGTLGNVQVGLTGDNEIDTASGNLTIDSAGGTVTVDDNLTVSGNASIVGNLTVSGTTTTLNSEVALADRFLLLNSNYTTNAALDGGLVVNVDPSATVYDGSSININFASTTTVQIQGDASTELAANKILIVRNAEDAANNGLYQVHSSSHSGGTTTVTIKDASTNTPSAAVSGIVNTAFTTNSDDDTAVIAKTKIAVLKSDTANNVFEVGFGDDGSSLSYTDLATAGGGITGLSTNASDTLTIGANYNLIPNTAGSTDLGSASAEFGHIFIADDKKIQFGDGQDSTIEYDEDGDDVLQIAGANVRIGHGAATQLQFRDSAVHLSSDADGYLNAQADTGITLNINGTDELALTASAATFGGNLVIPNGANIGSAGDTDALAISATGLITVSSTAEASSTTTGALRVSGGLGVAKDLWLGDDLTLDSDAVVISFGDDQDVTLTHVADTGLLLNGTMQLQFNDASQFINAPSATVLDINATDEVEINATLCDVNANLDVSGTYTGGGLMTTGGNIVIPDGGNIGSASDTNAIAISSAGVVALSATTAASATTTAALTVAGGLGVAGDIWLGDDLTLDSDAAVISLGADQDVTLTHVADSGILLNSTRYISFQDAGTKIYSSEDGQLDLASDGTMVDSILANASAGGIKLNAGLDGNAAAIHLDSASGVTIAGGDENDDVYIENSPLKLEQISAPSTTTDKLYNVSGTLTWNGSALQTGSGSTAADDISTGDAAVTIATSAGNITLDAQGNNTDIIFKGTDGGSDTTFLTLDGSDAGTAIFNHDVKLQSDGSKLYFGADDDVFLEHIADSGLILDLTTDAGGKPDFILKTAFATASAFSTLQFLSETASPAASDIIAEVAAHSKNAAAGDHEYGAIRFKIEDTTTNSEAGGIYFYPSTDGYPAGNNATEALKLVGNTSGHRIVDISGHDGANSGLKLGGTLVTSTAAELNLLDGITAGTVTASKALIVDSNKDLGTLRNLTIDGVFTDGNYTFDTSGNVSGLGTVGCGAITTSGDLTVNADTSTFASANTTDPVVIIKNTTNDANGARLKFVKDKGAAGADNDVAGLIEFYADDDNQDQVKFAEIKAQVADASNGAEGGKLSLSVAEHDGTSTAGLILTDGNADGEVDATIGAGASSLVTVPGAIKFTDSDASHSTTIKAHATTTADVTYTLPAADGSNTHVLQTNGSGVLSWVANGGGGGSATIPDVQILTTSTPVNAAFASSGSNGDNERVYLVNNSSTAVQINLPAVSGNTGKKFQIKRLGTANVTIAVQSGESLETTTDGTFVLTTQYSSVTVVCNASGTINGWYII